MRENRENAVAASFTVEAAFVVPFITMIVVLLIDMTLFLRDVSVAGELASRIAEETRALVLNDEDPVTGVTRYERKFTQSFFARWFGNTDSADAAEMTGRLTELLENRFWICRAQDASVRISGGVVTVRLKLKADSGVSLLGSLATRQWFLEEVVREVACRDTKRTARVYAAVMDTGSQIVGVKKVFETLSELVNRLR